MLVHSTSPRVNGPLNAILCAVKYMQQPMRSPAPLLPVRFSLLTVAITNAFSASPHPWPQTYHDRRSGATSNPTTTSWTCCAATPDRTPQCLFAHAAIEYSHPQKEGDPRYFANHDASLWQRLRIGRTAEDCQRWRERCENSASVPKFPDAYYSEASDWASWVHFLQGDELLLGGEESEVLPPDYFRSVEYEKFVPWDLRGQPQPAVRRAFVDWRGRASIIDVGCGAGDNANWLAGRGHQVVGIDINADAIRTAVERRDSAFKAAIQDTGGSADFYVASALSLDSSIVVERARAVNGFEVALDSGLLHCLSDDDQQQYVAQLASIVRTGGCAYVGCFSDENPSPWLNPRRLSKARLTEIFTLSEGWRILDISRTWWQRPVPPAAATEDGAHSIKTAISAGWCYAWWCVAERCAAP